MNIALWDMTVQIKSSSTLEVEAGVLGFWDQPGLHSETTHFVPPPKGFFNCIFSIQDK